jgi:phosphonate transport system substrate-binding protein
MEGINMRRITALLVAMAMTVAFSTMALASGTKEINFGIIATDSTNFLKQQFTPLADAMAKKTGYKVNMFFASDYAGIIEAMRFKKVDIAWYGNKSAISAVDRANAEVFCRISNPDNSNGYYSHLITHVDNQKINNLDDVFKHSKDLTFGNGDPNSTSGFLIPAYYVFALNKKDPVQIFKVVRNANHETNGLAVVNKQVDVATNNNKALRRMNKRWPDKRKQVKVVWTSPVIPSDPFAWRKDLDPEAKKKIKAFFLDLGRKGPNKEAEIQMLQKTMGGWGLFFDSSNDQLLPVRQLVLYKDRMKIERSKGLSDDEKKQRIAEIDAKLDKVAQRLAEIKKQ